MVHAVFVLMLPRKESVLSHQLQHLLCSHSCRCIQTPTVPQWIHFGTAARLSFRLRIVNGVAYLWCELRNGSIEALITLRFRKLTLIVRPRQSGAFKITWLLSRNSNFISPPFDFSETRQHNAASA